MNICLRVKQSIQAKYSPDVSCESQHSVCIGVIHVCFQVLQQVGLLFCLLPGSPSLLGTFKSASYLVHSSVSLSLPFEMSEQDRIQEGLEPKAQNS